MTHTHAIELPPVHRQPVERRRRRTSQVFFVIWALAALFTMPAALGTKGYAALELLGFALLVIAALGRMWCTVYIGGRKNRELCIAGPYRACRNPLYFFSFLGVVGACLALQNLTILLVTTPVFLLYYHQVIGAEEQRLGASFGQAYVDYCHDVPRFWPRWVDPRDQGELHVSARHFMRGLSEVFWFLIAIVVIDGIEWAHLADLWPSVRLPF